MKQHSDTKRYELIRALSPREFAELVFQTIEYHGAETYEESFDALVDKMIIKEGKKCRGKCK